MASTPSPALVELPFQTIVVGGENTKKFQSALLSYAGWTSDKDSELPIDIVVGLERPANIYKVVVEVIDENAPSEIDVQVGSYDQNPTVEVNYEKASGANYLKRGTMRFAKKSKKESLEDSQSLFVDSHGQFLWFVVDAPNNPKATGDRVSIHRLKIFGYKQSYETPKEPSPHKQSPEKPEKRTRKESKGEIKTERFSSEGDGLSINGEQIGGDPLTSLRIVKKVLGTKREKAIAEEKSVEATMCLRAIQRMAEYEKRLENLKSRMSDALIKGDIASAEKHRLAMADCRDTVFRSAHVDLLLDRSELRSIGVESQWAPEEEDQDNGM